MAFLRGQQISGSSTFTGSNVISGSLEIIEAGENLDFFIIKSGSTELLKANRDGVIQFHVYPDDYTPPVSLGSIYFNSSSAYLGLE